MSKKSKLKQLLRMKGYSEHEILCYIEERDKAMGELSSEIGTVLHNLNKGITPARGNPDG